jgi:hypothetical protein
MTKLEKDAFDAMAKKLFTYSVMVENSSMPLAAQLGNNSCATAVVPTYKLIKEIKKFVRTIKKGKK